MNIMTQYNYVAVTAAFVMVLTSCGDEKKQGVQTNRQQEVERPMEQGPMIANISFSNEMTGTIFENYQQIRAALVKSDANEVQAAATNLAKSFSEEQENIKATALTMADTDDLDKQRELFSEITASVEPLFKKALSEGTIYKQYCPMAFAGAGGYWMSNVDAIRNPYYGDKMLKCGKVVEEIAK